MRLLLDTCLGFGARNRPAERTGPQGRTGERPHHGLPTAGRRVVEGSRQGFQADFVIQAEDPGIHDTDRHCGQVREKAREGVPLIRRQP
jgi:hypothetical protein